MNSKLLIEAIMQQTTILIAQLSTAAGSAWRCAATRSACSG
jgi:hypothetical protein